jgi:hypothetical protein
MDKNEIVNTLGKTYIVRELKEGFDDFSLGETDVKIQMRPRQGVGKFTNFSNRCEILVAPENGKYKVGQSVFVPNAVVDNKISPKIAESLGVNIKYLSGSLYLGEHNILFEGEDITKIEGDEWSVFQIKKQSEVVENGITIIDPEDDTIGYVICGALNKGDKITWVSSKRIEIWQKEKQYWVTHKDWITSVNDEPYGEYYRIDNYSKRSGKVNGIELKGQTYARKLFGLSIPDKKYEIIDLYNPCLPNHGKSALFRRVKPMPFVHQDSLVALL